MNRDDIMGMGLVEQAPVTIEGHFDDAAARFLFEQPQVRTVTLYPESARLFGIERLALWPLRYEFEARVTDADLKAGSLMLTTGDVRRVIAPRWMRAAWWTFIVPWRRLRGMLWGRR